MITMKEIAREAGVSRATVSYILNGKTGGRLKISPPIIRKVKETAQRHGYVRNALVNSVVTGKSRVIAVISDFPHYLMPAVKGCVEEASAHGWLIQLIPLGDDINRAVMQALEFRVAGIFAISLSPSTIAQVDPKFLNCGIPSIGLEPKSGRMAFDQKQSAMRGTEYLISLGHRDIFFHYVPSDIAEERAAGYRAVMRRHKLPARLIRGVTGDEKSYYRQLEELIEKRPDAIQFASDHQAEDLLRLCYRKRLYVPDAFSVLGFGNIPGSEFSSPALSTVSEPYYETGQIMFRRIYNMIRTGTEPPYADLVGEVIERESTKRMRKTGIRIPESAQHTVKKKIQKG